MKTQKQLGFRTDINWKVRMQDNESDVRFGYTCFLCLRFPSFGPVWQEASKLHGIQYADRWASTVPVLLTYMLVNAGRKDISQIPIAEIAERIRSRLTAIIESPQYKCVSPKMVRDIMMQELEAEL